jgi:Flp pilus assembly protein TadG
MKRAQGGAVVIEFALVLLLFFAFLLGIIEASRMLYAWNAATQAVRVGARYAVVCEDGTGAYKDKVLQRMKLWAPQISAIEIEWAPENCLVPVDKCESVTVSITETQHLWLAPIPSSFKRQIQMPSFSTPLRREVMRQDDNSPKICS